MRRLLASVLLGFAVLAISVRNVEVNAEVPSENECRPYIEKAIHELQSHDHSDNDNKQLEESSSEAQYEIEIKSDETSNENAETELTNDEDSIEEGDRSDETSENVTQNDSDDDSNEHKQSDEADKEENITSDNEAENIDSIEEDVQEEIVENVDKSIQEEIQSASNEESNEDKGEINAQLEENIDQESNEQEENSESKDEEENSDLSVEEQEPEIIGSQESEEVVEEDVSEVDEAPVVESENTEERLETSEENEMETEVNEGHSEETDSESTETENVEVTEAPDSESVEEAQETDTENSKEAVLSAENSIESNNEEIVQEEEDKSSAEVTEKPQLDSEEEEKATKEEQVEGANVESAEEATEETIQSYPEDDLLLEYEIPTNLRDRSHVTELLHLDDESEAGEKALNKASDYVLKELKRIHETAIKPLETLYKYRDLSNRHFGDPEIFSKPLILFMGPWSGGKSTILNYLTDNEHTLHSFRTGAEPSPAYFNILMYGDEPEVLDGTQLAADWTFSGLQKFGQGLEDRLRGLKLPNKLLKQVNIVEIPGILEVRKQVSRLFPFNDACQWFIDRADIIFLVYDPSKLDVGPETEAILDQLKGREYQTRIILNKGDQVKPEELLRVQSALIWNISPLMSSAQPPVMYTTSLWSHPYEVGAPIRLLQAQERAFLRDLRIAIDKRIENKIASARRFAVRVRNHAKMVDCYLTTYYNHKTLFGNKKQIADQIINHPQNYHIYEGLSTLTNISRYDLPDPEVYRDFFHLNNLYDFKKLSETCTYFRGCPINKLDIAIAYDLPELVGKYKKLAETALAKVESKNTS